MNCWPCVLHLLAWKIAFLVALTSAKHVGEQMALRHDPAYLLFGTDGVILFPDISFLLKFVFQFHLKAELSLPVFYPDPTAQEERPLHYLSVRHALLFSFPLTGIPGSVASEGPQKGPAVLCQQLPWWTLETLRLTYWLNVLKWNCLSHSPQRSWPSPLLSFTISP